MSNQFPFVSVVIPVRDEAAAIESLINEITVALAGRAHEIIVVDDGSNDGTERILQSLTARLPTLRLCHHPVSRGQSTAIRSGVRMAQGPLIVTLDGDGQNPPDQIPQLLAPFANAMPDLGLVQGQRVARQDSLGKKLASRIANRIRGALLHDGVRDSGCGLKAFRRDAYFDLPFFDHIHRFMPAMMLREGWRVETVPVTHRARQSGRSKYSNLARALVGIPDLLGASWLILRSGGAAVPHDLPLTTTSNEREPVGPYDRDMPRVLHGAE